MSWNVVAEKWEKVKGGIKSKWAKLTDDDVGMLQGKREHLIDKIVERYGVLKEEAATQVDEWAHAIGTGLDAASAKVDASTQAAKGKNRANKTVGT